MDAESGRAFGDPLRRTAREPLFLRPLFWGSHHIDLLRISVVHLASAEIRPSDQTGNAPPRAAPTKEKSLPVGSVDHQALKIYWSWSRYGKDMADDWLSEVITKTIGSIQKEMKPKPFRIHVKEYCKPGPCLTFSFSNSSVPLLPEVIISTTNTNIPFLIYSGSDHKVRLRDDLAFERRVSSQSWRLLRDLASTRFDIDPFDVACLIAMAQEQRFRFTSSLSEVPDRFTVYLITSNNSSDSSLYLFTACIPEHYLDAMSNPDLEVTENTIITQEAIEIPSGDVPVGEGALIERIGAILEQAFSYHRDINEHQEKERGEWSMAGLSISSLQETIFSPRSKFKLFPGFQGITKPGLEILSKP